MEEPPMEEPPMEEPPMEDETPPPVDPDPPMDPPALTDVMIFEQTLFPALRDPANFCVGCHGVAQVPTFAVEDVMTAYNVITGQQKVDLQVPANSRVYLRAAQDRHNCGGEATCDQIAATFLTQIEAWSMQAAQSAPPAPPAAQVTKSATATFANALEASAARADANVIAKFDFDEGTGDTAMDSSGVGTPIMLQLQGTQWEDGGGLRNVSGKAQASLEHSQKLFNRIDASKAYTVEAWVIPDDTAQDGPARIVSYSIDTGTRNFTLGQNAIYFQLRNRSQNTSNNGTPALEPLEPQVSTNLQHVVATFDEATGRKVYIDGVLAMAEDTADQLQWSNDQLLVIGNEATDNRLWKGVLHMVAIHDQALNAAQVKQNFDAGLGDLVTLRFDVAEALGEGAVIEMLAKQVDANGYLFAEPTLYGNGLTDVAVKNLRIAVNDAVPVAAQAFRRIDTTVGQAPARLSNLGALIPVAMGIEADQFHLEFEVLGNNVGEPEPISPPIPPVLPVDEDEPSFGVRSFAQLNDTMSALTGVDQRQNAVRDLYADLLGQLPASNDLLSFSASSQIAIQRLATGYCSALVNNNGACSEFFGQCSIPANGKEAVAGAIFDQFVGADLATQPDRAAVITELVSVMDDLGCVNGCNNAAGREVLSASCAAVLSSSAVTVN